MNDCQIVCRILADQLGCVDATVVKFDFDCLRTVNDVIVGEDKSLRIDDGARAGSLVWYHIEESVFARGDARDIHHGFIAFFIYADVRRFFGK